MRQKARRQGFERKPRAWRSALVLAALVRVAVVAQQPAPSTRLDALVATVGPRVITVSDARLLQELGLVEEPSVGSFRALVDRALMLAEVERFQAPAPITARVDQELAQLRTRVGEGEWSAMLRRNGADDERVRAIVKEELQLETYLDQRFGVLAEPSDEALRQAYEARQAALPPGETLPPFDAIRPALWSESRSTRYATLVAEWVAELRQRADVSLGNVPEGLAR